LQLVVGLLVKTYPDVCPAEEKEQFSQTDPFRDKRGEGVSFRIENLAARNLLFTAPRRKRAGRRAGTRIGSRRAKSAVRSGRSLATWVFLRRSTQGRSRAFTENDQRFLAQF